MASARPLTALAGKDSIAQHSLSLAAQLARSAAKAHDSSMARIVVRPGNRLCCTHKRALLNSTIARDMNRPHANIKGSRARLRYSSEYYRRPTLCKAARFKSSLWVEGGEKEEVQRAESGCCSTSVRSEMPRSRLSPM